MGCVLVAHQRLNILPAGWSQTEHDSSHVNSCRRFGVETRTWLHVQRQCQLTLRLILLGFTKRQQPPQMKHAWRVHKNLVTTKCPEYKTTRCCTSKPHPLFSCLNLYGMIDCRQAAQAAAAGCFFILGRERSSSWFRKLRCHLALLLCQQFSISSMKYPTNSGLINGLWWLSAFVHWCKCFSVARAWAEN